MVHCRLNHEGYSASLLTIFMLGSCRKIPMQSIEPTNALVCSIAAGLYLYPQPLHSQYPHLGCRQRHPPPQVGSDRIFPAALGPSLGLVGWTSSWMQAKSPEIASCAKKKKKKIGAFCTLGAGIYIHIDGAL